VSNEGTESRMNFEASDAMSIFAAFSFPLRAASSSNHGGMCPTRSRSPIVVTSRPSWMAPALVSGWYICAFLGIGIHIRHIG